ncbi:LPXTG cell wall anchor domain-containing protein [Nocardioides nitrophenolicus]|uniref:LPXTG cell wall anchor domain-containing protein n=1 Tax=Nocardioides nitrophenolicus TaxID=60489 RepID=UPI001959D666|nr:LPXTG cell wall anchor domain-containing protein [Nocardioides nitrophenolicus]MBM7519277.1 LPXTG-motif cell wall-anchored protein [Nocardioides nitrophenolicus]
MRRYLVLGSVVLAPVAFLIGLAGAASADPYSPAVPTSCRVVVPAASVGERVVLRVRVSAAGVQPVGKVTVGVDGDFEKTVRYDGLAVEVEGPRVQRGQHKATALFTPDDPKKLMSCKDAVKFDVGAAQRGGGHGALPNTGGPHLGFLIAGIGLVAAGGGLVERGRRT